ncbi:hypothetical protein HPB50_025533 [Hyalomma asiaticum]|uniref:Uncharacterized protein n=1 Tax=Hyalomma asiaticum TaxID=266040 RepID=A0ACB7SPH1_HYAAI|nr:hypothetical protein HPB50_025533 [Hyalomma asiaticum]
MPTFKFATWNVRGFRDKSKQRDILSFAQAQGIDVLFIQEANFRSPLDVVAFRRDFHVDAFFSLTSSRACGVGVIFVSGRFRQKSHCTFGADGRMIMLDVYIEGKRVRFINLYAPLRDLHQLLLEPLPHVLLGDFNCVVDSQRDVRGPGQGSSTYQAKELVKVLRHLSLTDVWVHLHNDHFGPTRLSKTSASRIDRTYLPDYLLASVVECEVVDLPGNLSGKSDHLPLATTVRGSPGFSSHNLGWRLDPSLLHDEVCVQRVRDRIRESLENVPSLTPHVWDTLKERWKKLLQEEGRDRKRRLSAQMGEILRRMRIVKEAESLTSCTREYLETLQVTYTHLLQLKTRRPGKEPDPPGSSTDPGSRDVYGNGGASDFFGKGLLLYWCSTNTKHLDADRHTGPVAEFPSAFYKMTENTKRMLDKDASSCDIDRDPPARIAETLTRSQLSPEECGKTASWKRSKAKLSRGLPRESTFSPSSARWNIRGDERCAKPRRRLGGGPVGGTRMTDADAAASTGVGTPTEKSTERKEDATDLSQKKTLDNGGWFTAKYHNSRLIAVPQTGSEAADKLAPSQPKRRKEKLPPLPKTDFKVPIDFENAVEVEIRVQDQAGSRNKKGTTKEAHKQEGRKQPAVCLDAVAPILRGQCLRLSQNRQKDAKNELYAARSPEGAGIAWLAMLLGPEPLLAAYLPLMGADYAFLKTMRTEVRRLRKEGYTSILKWIPAPEGITGKEMAHRTARVASLSARLLGYSVIYASSSPFALAHPTRPLMDKAETGPRAQCYPRNVLRRLTNPSNYIANP